MADKEYIEREAVEKFIAKGLNNPDKSKAYGYDAVEILSEVHHMDAADVVEVVRCKECTEWDEEAGECSHWYGFKENDFCSHGERKE